MEQKFANFAPMETSFNPMQEIKRAMYAHRNGVVAERVRNAGWPYQIVFGVTLAELAEIAAAHGHDSELALQLRADVRNRESMLLAPMLVDPQSLSDNEAREWVASVTTTEVADVLANRLLRKWEGAQKFARTLAGEGCSDLERYVGLRLELNLLSDLDGAKAMAQAELRRGCALTRGVARQIIDEVEWRQEGV